MDSSWYAVDWGFVVGAAATGIGIYVALVALLRLNGLRSLTKMSSVDFVTTVAFGSVLASVLLADTPSLSQGVVVLAVLFAVQGLVALARQRWTARPFENAPVLLMDGPQILHDNLRATRVTEDDLYAKLREANVLHRGQVRAVVLEGTGDVTVLHGDEGDWDPDLLRGVRRGI